MDTITPTVQPEIRERLSFKYLPAYIKCLRDQYLVDYVHTVLSLAKANNIPLLQFFDDYTEDQLIELSKQSSFEFLTWLADNKASEQIEEAVTKWKENKLELVGQHEITMEDVTLVSYVRKKALTSLLPLYTTDFMQAVMILNDLEDYFKEADTAFSSTYIGLLESRLRLKEEQLEEAQVLTGAGNFAVNTETMEGDISPMVLQILGLKKGAKLKGFLERMHPEDRKVFEARFQESIIEGKPLDVEYRYNVNGREKIIWSRGNIQLVGGVKYMKGTVMDVTERHSMLRKLQENEKLYKQAQERAHIGNFVWNLQTNEVFWSEELYRIYGLDPATDVISYKRYTDMLRVEDRVVLLHNIEKTVQTGEPLDFDFRVTQLSGDQKILNIKADLEKDSMGMPWKFIGTIQDITDKQRLIDQLEERDRLYKQAQASTHLGNWNWNLSTGRITWSEEMYRIYGIPADSPLSYDNQVKLMHPDYAEAHYLHVQELLNTGAPQEYYCRILRPDGEERIVHARLERVDDQAGNPLQIIGTSQDVTELQLLIERLQKGEEELQKKNRELELSNSNLQEFAYVASHDLKEPLRKISTFGEMLFQFTSDKLDDKAKFYVEKMVEGSKRMQNMIEELLTFAVISNNKAFQRTSLQEVLRKVLADLEFKIQAKEATVQASGLPEVPAVASQMEQLFMNLISNSLKFSREGVPPVITISHYEPGKEEKIQAGLYPRSRYVKISFEDNGIGFEPEYSQKIFGMFQRLHGKVDYEGSGIGLSICKKIVEHHSGIINASSSPGEGARFDIFLPLG